MYRLYQKLYGHVKPLKQGYRHVCSNEHARGKAHPFMFQRWLSMQKTTPTPFPFPTPTPQQKPQKQKWLLFIAGAGGICVIGYLVDKYYYASTLTRTVRTAYYGILISLDYKLNFNPGNEQNIYKLHERVAKRIHHVCTKNGGVYIKLGQAIGVQASVLPKPYRDAFQNIFDAVDPEPYQDIERVFYQEFGKYPEDVFDDFNKEAIASASIAQVHLAKIGDKEYAVKIQKPAIRKQMKWDLWAYKTLLWTYEKLFDLPAYFFADYVTKQIKAETYFKTEASNAEKTSQLIQSEPSLNGKIRVPKVLWEHTSDRVMTAEYEGGCKLNDIDQIKAWNLNMRDIMDSTSAVFAAMIFKWGHVHCDPHPGNILVRPSAQNARKPEIILIDHGLYITLSRKFLWEYCSLWRSLFVNDVEKIDSLVKGWGLADSNLFASLTLLRPFQVHKGNKRFKNEVKTEESIYEQEVEVKARFKALLENENLIPKELILLTRCMRIVQANNQTLGSPSNRVYIFSTWASKGLATFSNAVDQTLFKIGFRQWFTNKLELLTFKVALFFVDIGFILSKIRQYLYAVVLNKKEGEGFEDLLARQIQDMAQNELGMEIDSTAFIG